jgi:cephalosporin hydroxylase
VRSTPSDIHEHLHTFVDTVLTMEATTVIELGTRTGVSTIAWLHGLQQTGGHLWSVDLDARPDIGEHDHWTFIQGDDMDPDVLAQLPHQADIIFIDTSHFYSETVAEIELYQHLVRPGGAMLFHDTAVARPMDAPARPLYPVRTAIEEFCAAEGRPFFNVENNNGLGIVLL